MLVALIVYSVFPIYMITVESLKTIDEEVVGNPFYVVHPNFEWYAGLFEQDDWIVYGAVTRKTVPFLVWSANTALAFGAALLLALGASIAAACALARLRPPGWRWWRRVLFATILVPQTILFLLLYQLVYHLHLDDNLLFLILVYPMLGIPFCVWLLSAYFQKLSPEIEESAYIEGAGRFSAFFRIVLPMSWPVLVAAGLFALGTMSADFMYAGAFLPKEWHQTITSGLGTMDITMEDLTVVAGVGMVGIPFLAIAACLAGAYVRGLTAAMIEGA